MKKESEPIYFLGREIAEGDLRASNRTGSNIGIDETGKTLLLISKYRGDLNKVLRRLAEEKILDLSPQPTTLLCDGNMLLQERPSPLPEGNQHSHLVRKISEEEIWDSAFLKRKRNQSESRRIDRTLGDNKFI